MITLDLIGLEVIGLKLIELEVIVLEMIREEVIGLEIIGSQISLFLLTITYYKISELLTLLNRKVSLQQLSKNDMIHQN